MPDDAELYTVQTQATVYVAFFVWTFILSASRAAGPVVLASALGAAVCVMVAIAAFLTYKKADSS